MEKIESQQAPLAVGPYSQAVQVGNTLYASGQLGLDRETGALVEGIEAQTTQAFRNIEYVLKEAGLTLADVVKVTVLLADMADFTTVNTLYAQHFTEPYPARSAFQVAALPLGGLIEIEVIAHKA